MCWRRRAIVTAKARCLCRHRPCPMTSVTTTVAFIALLAVHQVLTALSTSVKPRYTKLANHGHSFIPSPRSLAQHSPPILLANQRLRKCSVKGLSAVNERLVSFLFTRHSAEQAFEQDSAGQGSFRRAQHWD